MSFHSADPTSLALFILLAVAMYGLIIRAFQGANVPKKFVVGFTIYIILFSVVVASGFAETHIIPIAPILFGSVIAGAIYFAFGRVGKQISLNYGLAALLGLQSFRLLLELILHHWAQIGTVPMTMTWTGQNWDVVTGIVCLIGFPFVQKSKAVAWGLQIIGFALLMNIFRVVMMSSPFPFSWQLENPLQLILHFPYALIGPLFVGVALFGHLVVFRKLLMDHR